MTRTPRAIALRNSSTPSCRTAAGAVAARLARPRNSYLPARMPGGGRLRPGDVADKGWRARKSRLARPRNDLGSPVAAVTPSAEPPLTVRETGGCTEPIDGGEATRGGVETTDCGEDEEEEEGVDDDADGRERLAACGAGSGDGPGAAGAPGGAGSGAVPPAATAGAGIATPTSNTPSATVSATRTTIETAEGPPFDELKPPRRNHADRVPKASPLSLAVLVLLAHDTPPRSADQQLQPAATDPPRTRVPHREAP